jgi:hypothetical protein
MALDSQPKLQTLLQNIMQADHVYFQPNENTQLQYPCVVYQRDAMATQFAANQPWRRTLRYSVTLISRDPNSPYLEPISQIPLSSYDRGFVVDGLNHDTFYIYF